MSGFNLDDMDNLENVQPATTQDADQTFLGGIVHQAGGSKLDAVYDKYQKFVYVIDISGSMGEGMLPGEIDQVAYWSPIVLDKIKAKLVESAKIGYGWTHSEKAAIDFFKSEVDRLTEHLTQIDEHIIELNEALADASDEDEKEEIMDEIGGLGVSITEAKAQLELARNPTPEQLEAKRLRDLIGFDLDDEESLKVRIYTENLDKRFGVELARTGLGLSSINKITVVKKSTVRFVDERLQKYPKADITVIKFDDKVEVLGRKLTKEQLIDRINSMHPRGGTDIYRAVFTALQECKARPAALGANHIVLVTDGDSHTVDGLQALVADMIQKHVVLDFVFIEGTAGSGYSSPYAKGYVEQIKKISAATNGIVVTVNNALDLEKKLFEVSVRKCLPAATE